MPYLMGAHEGAAAKQLAGTDAPFGPGFPPEVVEKMAKLEVWGSSIKDAGSDYVVFKAFDADGKEIRVRTVGGY